MDLVRPPHAVFLRGDESEVEFNGGSGEAPAHLCFRGGNCEVASEMSGSDVFHPVIRWSVVLQRYFNNRSCMVVAFLVWCGPLFL